MAVTPSSMSMKIGSFAPNFRLLDVAEQKEVTLNDLRSDKATVIVFMCNHCPYVLHILDKLIEVANTYLPKGVAFIGINSNDVEKYISDSPEKMIELIAEKKLPFPYLFDETQAVAKAFNAACTPDFYIFDKNLRCAYRGRFDDSTPGNTIPITGSSLSAALDDLLNGKMPSAEQRNSIGCNIKWKER